MKRFMSHVLQSLRSAFSATLNRAILLAILIVFVEYDLLSDKMIEHILEHMFHVV